MERLFKTETGQLLRIPKYRTGETMTEYSVVAIIEGRQVRVNNAPYTKRVHAFERAKRVLADGYFTFVTSDGNVIFYPVHRIDLLEIVEVEDD